MLTVLYDTSLTVNSVPLQWLSLMILSPSAFALTSLYSMKKNNLVLMELMKEFVGITETSKSPSLEDSKGDKSKVVQQWRKLSGSGRVTEVESSSFMHVVFSLGSGQPDWRTYSLQQLLHNIMIILTPLMMLPSCFHFFYYTFWQFPADQV